MVLSRREHELLRQVEERLRADDPVFASRIDRYVAIMPCMIVERAPNSRPQSRTFIMWTAIVVVGALLLFTVLFAPAPRSSMFGEARPERHRLRIASDGNPGDSECGSMKAP